MRWVRKMSLGLLLLLLSMLLYSAPFAGHSVGTCNLVPNSLPDWISVALGKGFNCGIVTFLRNETQQCLVSLSQMGHGDPITTDITTTHVNHNHGVCCRCSFTSWSMLTSLVTSVPCIWVPKATRVEISFRYCRFIGEDRSDYNTLSSANLTHCGRVTQICVFTLQLCKTDDTNLRF